MATEVLGGADETEKSPHAAPEVRRRTHEVAGVAGVDSQMESSRPARRDIEYMSFPVPSNLPTPNVDEPSLRGNRFGGKRATSIGENRYGCNGLTADW